MELEPLYRAEEYTDYQSLESGTILTIELDHFGTALRLETHREVWSPTPFTIEMGKLIAAEGCRGKIVMDFACGSGFLSLVAGRTGAARVVATDLNPKAITMTGRNWALNGLDSGRLCAVESDCFDAIRGDPEVEGRFDVIYSNPPTAPDLPGEMERLSAGDWNRNGEGGRTVNDALITEGRNFLKAGGEILFVTTGKQGARLTCELLDRYWGEGIRANGENPLDYAIDWTKRGSANWAVVRRMDLPLSDYYLPFLPRIEEFARDRGQPAPFVTKEGRIHQRLYFIRARKNH